MTKRIFLVPLIGLYYPAVSKRFQLWQTKLHHPQNRIVTHVVTRKLTLREIVEGCHQTKESEILRRVKSMLLWQKEAIWRARASKGLMQ